MEFAAGIPGTLGGGVAMNAGAYGGQISDVLVDAQVLVSGEEVTLTRAEMEMGYRTSCRSPRLPVLSARLRLTRGDPGHSNTRARLQRPPPRKAAAFSSQRRFGVQAAGGPLCRGADRSGGPQGADVGEAQVSEKHAGFIVNLGGATAHDVLA